MIKPKEHICKGINKANGVPGCGVKTLYRKYGLCMKCYPEFITETDAGKLILEKAIIKAQKPRLAMETAKREYDENKSLKAAHINTKMQVHTFVRKRDLGKPCISCGCAWQINFQAGHFYKAETFETLKYDLDNISGQCHKCNIFFDGNFDNYSLRLPDRIGKKRYEALVKKAEIDKHFEKFWTIEKLKEVRNNLKLTTS